MPYDAEGQYYEGAQVSSSDFQPVSAFYQDDDYWSGNDKNTPMSAFGQENDLFGSQPALGPSVNDNLSLKYGREYEGIGQPYWNGNAWTLGSSGGTTNKAITPKVSSSSGTSSSNRTPVSSGPSRVSSMPDSRFATTPAIATVVRPQSALQPVIPPAIDRFVSIPQSMYQTTTTFPETSNVIKDTWGRTVTAPQTQITTGETTSTTHKVPTMALPQYQETPALVAPPRNAMRERMLAQEEASLGVGEWRQSLKSGLNKIMSEGNFAARGAQMRELFSGAGKALGRILQSASSAARKQYNEEYATAVSFAVENYRGQLQQRLSKYSQDIQMYLGTMENQTTQSSNQSVFTSGGGTTTTGGTTVTENKSGGGQLTEKSTTRPAGY